ncbi:MAG: hypothetical protein JSS02_05515 [Planctomycetes bacterium]|nr:hypothetical protein [Planctomycetota bacterium]
MPAPERLRLTRQLLELTVSAFDEKELAEGFYFAFGKRLAEVVTVKDNLRMIVLDLLVWADKDGSLGELAQALAELKPNRHDLAEVVAQLQHVLAPPPAPIVPADRLPADPRPASAGLTVFLATATPDERGQADRKAVADALRHLKQVTVRLLPEIVYESDTYDTQLDADLDQCQLFVQVLGESGSEASALRPHGIEGLQFARAHAKGLPCLRWRPRDLTGDAIIKAGPAYFHYLSGAADPPDIDPQERIQPGYLADFQRQIEQSLVKLAARRNKRSVDRKIAVLVRTQETDEALSRDLDQRLRQRAQTFCQIVDEFYPLDEVYEDERGLVVIHGQSSADWVEQRVAEFCDIALEHETNPPVCAVFVGPPDGKPPLRKRPAGFHLIRHDDPQAFDKFLAAFQGRNGGPG